MPLQFDTALHFFSSFVTPHHFFALSSFATPRLLFVFLHFRFSLRHCAAMPPADFDYFAAIFLCLRWR